MIGSLFTGLDMSNATIISVACVSVVHAQLNGPWTITACATGMWLDVVPDYPCREFEWMVRWCVWVPTLTDELASVPTRSGVGNNGQGFCVIAFAYIVPIS